MAQNQKLEWEWSEGSVLLKGPGPGETSVHAFLNVGKDDVEHLGIMIAEAIEVYAVLCAAWATHMAGAAESYKGAIQRIKEIRLEKARANVDQFETCLAISAFFKDPKTVGTKLSVSGKAVRFAQQAIDKLLEAADARAKKEAEEAEGEQESEPAKPELEPEPEVVGTDGA